MSTAVFMFDLTGNMARPWADAGYDCLIVDRQHPAGLSEFAPNITAHGTDMLRWIPPRKYADPIFAAAFPPCDHLAVSGARWFQGKGLQALSDAIELFARAAEWCEWLGCPYMIENPVSTISTYWRQPDYTFHPWQYAGLEPRDGYTKKTCLWAGGGFVMPAPDYPDSLIPDDRIHKAPPGPERANFRSATPLGFAKAVFAANEPKRIAA